MDPEVKERLDQLEALEKENNKILRSLRTQARWTRVWGFLKVVIFIVPLFAAYYYLQPYLDMMVKTYQKLQEQTGLFDQTKSQVSSFGDLLKKFSGGSSTTQ